MFFEADGAPSSTFCPPVQLLPSSWAGLEALTVEGDGRERIAIYLLHSLPATRLELDAPDSTSFLSRATSRVQTGPLPLAIGPSSFELQCPPHRRERHSSQAGKIAWTRRLAFSREHVPNLSQLHGHRHEVPIDPDVVDVEHRQDVLQGSRLRLNDGPGAMVAQLGVAGLPVVAEASCPPGEVHDGDRITCFVGCSNGAHIDIPVTVEIDADGQIVGLTIG
jgi:hypothetical protein